MDMTDLDAAHVAFADAVFGGPLASLAIASSVLAASGTTPPLRVVALAESAERSGVEASRTWNGPALKLHPGMVYALVPRYGRIDWEGAIHSRPVPFETASELLDAVRAAIVSLRRRQVRTGKAVATQDLQALTQVMLAQVQRGQNWRPTLSTTMDAVLVHHLDHLKTARRRLVEIAIDLARPLRNDRDVSAACHSVLEAVLNAYDFAQLRDQAFATLCELASLVASRTVSTNLAESASLRRVQHAQHIIERDFRLPISLADLALSAGCSTAHLARCFREATGQTVVQALQKRRLEESRRILLAHPQRPLPTVAMDAGFGSVEHFHRLFVRTYQITPASWRDNPQTA